MNARAERAEDVTLRRNDFVGVRECCRRSGLPARPIGFDGFDGPGDPSYVQCRHGCGCAGCVVAAHVQAVESALERRPEIMHEVPAGGRIGFRRHAAQIRRQLIDRPVRLGRTEQNDVRIDAKPRAVFVVAAFRIVELNAPSIALLLLDGSQSDSPGDGFAIEQAADNPLVLCERLPTQCQRPDLGRVQHNDPRPPAGLRQSRGQRVSRGTELVLAFVQQDRHGTLTLIEEAGDLFRADQIGRNAGG